MISLADHKIKIEEDGFSIIHDVFTDEEISQLLTVIEQLTEGNSNFRKNKDLFAIRNFLNEVPEIKPFLWTKDFNDLIDNLLGDDYFLVKAIYFNKPPMSNWLVTWHQDTKISVDKKLETNGFEQWSLKQGMQAVQPSQDVLESIYTIRIHLDDCDETNGGLKVVPKTHKLGILKDLEIQNIDKKNELCAVKKGGVLIMKPLLVHGSSKSTSANNRRIIHLEFSSKELPNGLNWRERVDRK